MEIADKYRIRKEDLKVGNWEYVGEGNQHLLIKCTDQTGPLFGYLMRFNKKAQHDAHHTNQHEKEEKKEESSTTSNEEQKDQQKKIKKLQDNLQKYVWKYFFKDIKNLNIFLQEAIPVDYSECSLEFQEFVRLIDEKIYSQRSDSKREKKIDITQTIEIIENFQQNYGFHNSRYSAMVEIKPKSPLEELYTEQQIQGELEKYNHEEQEIIKKRFIEADKYEKCRFFKMQLNKLENDSECQQLSKYRPIDLFDGKIEQEMNNLLETPLNNLVITQYSGETKESSQILEQVSELKVALSAVQRMIHLYLENNSRLEEVFNSFESRATFYLEQPESFFQSVLAEILTEINSNSDLSQALQNDFANLQTKEDVSIKEHFVECKLVLKFLLSIAFRDLSILINVYTTHDNKEELSHQNQHQKKFQTQKSSLQQNELIHSRVAIIDNDLKPLSTYQKYTKIEKTNLKLYLKYLLNKQQ